MKFLINNFRNLNGDFKYSLTFTRFTKKGYELLIYDNFSDAKKALNFGKYAINMCLKKRGQMYDEKCLKGRKNTMYLNDI